MMNLRHLPFIPLVLALLALTLLALGLPRDPFFIDLGNMFTPPTGANPLGTDELGRDILARLARGSLLSIGVAAGVLLLAGITGLLVGIVSGWFGGWVDALLMRITDVFLSFPGILIAICFAALAGPGVGNVVLALGLMGWVGMARLTRVQVLALRNEEHLQAARLSGVRPGRLLTTYLLPNIAAPLIVEAVFLMAGAIIAEAGLSFLGIGVQPPFPSLGAMLREGARYMLVAPHLVFAPGVCLMLLVLLLSLLGEGLRDRLDVRQRVEARP